mgnify:FL=1|jgi:hypothetical protein|tara:strand:+ start:52 stop:678 length:627 start_codon:yes stop_codon:yes gene_type:complete
MTVMLDPEIGVPLPPNIPYIDLRERAAAACATAILLSEHGLDIELNREDKDVAASLTLQYAQDPENTSKQVTSKKAAKLTPASLILTSSILQEFGHSVAKSSAQIRYLVTNKLLLESENPDAKIRIRALELLGKISDVGLFAEKSEVTITHQSTDDLRANLRQKLEKLVNPPVYIEEAVIIDGDIIDVDVELGLNKPKEAFEGEYDDE